MSDTSLRSLLLTPRNESRYCQCMDNEHKHCSDCDCNGDPELCDWSECHCYECNRRAREDAELDEAEWISVEV